MDYVGLGIFFLLFLTIAFRFIRSVQIVPTQKKHIVERLGKYSRTLEPGFHILIPYVDNVAFKQDLREQSIEVPPQEAFTKDNVRVEVDGVLYIRVEDAFKASYGVTDFRTAAILLAQTTTRSVIGTLELDRTFEERDVINKKVVDVLGEVADDWGIRVERYEIKNIVPPNSVREAMERQMGAERERRALLARAEGQKMALINDSEGTKMELINNSEGEMQRRINEAQGRSEEILAIARATAESILKLGEALTVVGGSEAVRLRLSQDYLKNLRKLGRRGTKVLVPGNLSAIDELLKSVGLDADAAASQAASIAEEVETIPRTRYASDAPIAAAAGYVEKEVVRAIRPGESLRRYAAETAAAAAETAAAAAETAAAAAEAKRAADEAAATPPPRPTASAAPAASAAVSAAGPGAAGQTLSWRATPGASDPGAVPGPAAAGGAVPKNVAPVRPTVPAGGDDT